MDPVQEDSKSRNFVLTAQALHAALPKMAMATRAIHADDFASPHRAIAPPIQVTVNYRYHRDPEQLVPMENKDGCHQISPRFTEHSS